MLSWRHLICRNISMLTFPSSSFMLELFSERALASTQVSGHKISQGLTLRNFRTQLPYLELLDICGTIYKSLTTGSYSLDVNAALSCQSWYFTGSSPSFLDKMYPLCITYISNYDRPIKWNTTLDHRFGAICLRFLSSCMSVYCVCLWPAEVRQRHRCAGMGIIRLL